MHKKSSTGVVITKKIIVAVLSFMLFSGVFAACGQPGAGKDNPAGQNDSGAKGSKVEFTVIEDAGALPENIRNAMEMLKEQRGYALFEKDGSMIVFISSGKKSTGGYETSVTSVEDMDGVVKITAQEKVPGKDDMVTEVITYPAAIIRIPKVLEQIKVVNEKGEEFKLLSTDDSQDADADSKAQDVIEAEGTYVGQIDGHSIEITISGTPTAFQYYEQELKDAVDKLKEDEKVKLTYYKNEHGQLMLTGLKKADS